MGTVAIRNMDLLPRSIYCFSFYGDGAVGWQAITNTYIICARLCCGFGFRQLTRVQLTFVYHGDILVTV